MADNKIDKGLDEIIKENKISARVPRNGSGRGGRGGRGGGAGAARGAGRFNRNRGGGIGRRQGGGIQKRRSGGPMINSPNKAVAAAAAVRWFKS